MKTVPVWRDTVRLIVAGLIAVGFHFLLWFMFTTRPEGSSGTARAFRGVTMVALDDPMKLETRRFLALMTYRDPTLIAKPNDVHGYSSLFRKPSFIPPEDDVIDPDRTLVPLAESPELKLAPLKSFSNSQESSTWVRPKIPPPPLERSPTAKTGVHPRWLDENGDESRQLFKNVAEVAKLVEKYRPSGRTMIQINWRSGGFLPGVKLIERCGSTDLDALAVKTLLANVSKMSSKRSLGGAGAVTVVWSPATGTRTDSEEKR